MARLVLGPLLRYVDDSTATIWVETDAPCEVTVLGASSRTFTVHGHHYALVDVTGLGPGSSITYTVELDGQRVWPPPDSYLPPSRIRTLQPDGSLRLAVGSCRRNATHDESAVAELGHDALRAYGNRLADRDEESWPGALVLIGDQVYADALWEAMREVIAARRDPGEPPGWEIADFEEYTQLYRLYWSDPVVRWLLSTVPSMMIFDDHDVRDDWNISRAWLKRMEAQPWWRERVTAGLGAYWIYQHLGNLSPKERADDPLLTALRSDERSRASLAETTAVDRGAILDELAWHADQQRDGRWNYARDIGGTRVVVLDSRGGRVLDPGERLMLGPRQLAWLDEQARGDMDHLLIVTSIPYLLPSGIHHLEAWNEALCNGAWGARVAEKSERFRQRFDLEHWASFQRSFAALADIVTELATGGRGEPPASITFLSGDVHYSYLARVRTPLDAAPIHQVVSSPIRNQLPWKLRCAVRVASLGVVGPVSGALARAAGVRSTPLNWSHTHGNWFSNVLAEIHLRGREATVRWHTPASEQAYGPGAEPLMRELGAADITRHATVPRQKL